MYLGYSLCMKIIIIICLLFLLVEITYRHNHYELTEVCYEYAIVVQEGG